MDRRTLLQAAAAGAALAAARPVMGQGASPVSSDSRVIDIHTHMYTTGWVDTVRANPDDSIRIVQGQRYEEIDYRGARITRLAPNMTDFDLRVRNMDEAGVDIAVISLTAPNVYVATRDLSVRLARQINDDFAAEQNRFPERIRWMASLPWEHADEALTELARAKSAGAVGVCTLTNILGTALTDERYASIWAAIEESGLPVFIHPTTPFVDGMGLADYGLANTIGFTSDTSLCFARMFLDGFMDRYPRIKLIACHGGGALPYLIARFDRMWEAGTSQRSSAQPPSAYLRRVWFDSIVYDQETLEFLVSRVGPDRVLYGSDYPFLIGDMAGMLARVDALPADQRAAIRGPNAAALFNI